MECSAPNFILQRLLAGCKTCVEFLMSSHISRAHFVKKNKSAVLFGQFLQIDGARCGVEYNKPTCHNFIYAHILYRCFRNKCASDTRCAVIKISRSQSYLRFLFCRRRRVNVQLQDTFFGNVARVRSIN